MKMMKKLSALALVIVMMLAMTVTAFAAQEVKAGKGGEGEITVNKAAKGETYTLYQLFTAQVDTDSHSISYKGTIPDTLTDYFEYVRGTTDEYGIRAKSETVSPEMSDALKTWASTAAEMTHATAEDNTVVFQELPYGYYVITSTNGGGTAISLTSTNPTGTINDKNTTVPTVDPTNGKQISGDDKVYVGETVTYTLTFTTSNYIGADDDAELVTAYTITDTLPAYLSNVNVTKIAIKQTGEEDIDYKVSDAVPQFTRTGNAGAGTITIPWADNGSSLYKNGATVEVTYTAMVTDKIAIAGAGNDNTFTLSYTTDEGQTGTPEQGSSTETIYSYAIVIKKIDQSGRALPGATFSVSGLQAAETDEEGVYFVSGKTAAGGTDTVMSTNDEGILILKGVDDAEYQVTEVTAPAGYNKLTTSEPVRAQVYEEVTTTTEKYWGIDANGNYTESDTAVTGGFSYTNDQLAATVLPIVNKTGSTLPSTGGIGTTIFYVGGGILVAAALILLVTKKRMSGRA